MGESRVFTYAQATPDWYATAVLQRQKMIETILSPRMTKRVKQCQNPHGDAGTELSAPAAKEVTNG